MTIQHMQHTMQTLSKCTANIPMDICKMHRLSIKVALTLASSSATERSALKDKRRPPLAAVRSRRPFARSTKAASQASAASL
jgi:hypothetical protein